MEPPRSAAVSRDGTVKLTVFSPRSLMMNCNVATTRSTANRVPLGKDWFGPKAVSISCCSAVTTFLSDCIGQILSWGGHRAQIFPCKPRSHEDELSFEKYE